MKASNIATRTPGWRGSIVALCGALVLGGCATTPAPVPEAEALDVIPVVEVTEQEAKVEPYRIGPGDQLEFKFFDNAELNEIVTVRPDGMITLQLIDEVKAEGLTPAQLDTLVTGRYALELRNPRISVFVRTFASQTVYVGGEVNNPNVVPLTPGMTPLEAAFQAGGIKDSANLGEIYVIRGRKPAERRAFAVNLNAALSGEESGYTLALQSGDIVYVPKSGIAKANLFVDQYIRNLLMFGGWSISIDNNNFD